ncbi:SMR domain-containing protein At5g58720 isoform X2 [Telopea speciosissima]|uniref:SMR domain-containing protein At5g58720 isoform X1 n=1 Tax=Telopea speciosissima TaxID=54955 RepID=UPI001CC37CDD|nr:SMR domain-containing protein At5g58720 isoform X1 [Telopea speciosissima]XP_043724355.1 SMR domain-containing protein At5g58720 isoform X2 [Telopea speciosissima]
MKPSRRKRKSRASQRNGREVSGDEKKEKDRGLECLTELLSSVSLDGVGSAYREVKEDPNKEAEIIGGFSENVGSAATSSISSENVDSAATSSTSSESCFEANVVQTPVRSKGFRGSKQKRVVASTGTVSSFLGKDYVMSSPRKSNEVSKEHLSNEETEQFLCSMLGDECELSMAVVRDVLCQCGCDVGMALDILLELSSSSYDQSKSCGYVAYSEGDKQDRGTATKCNDSLDGTIGECKIADRALNSTVYLSEQELEEILQSARYDSRYDSGIKKSSLPQKVLESLFNIPKSAEHDPSSMNWKNVVKKMDSLGKGLDFHSAGTKLQLKGYAEGDEYQVFRKESSQHWDSMKSCYQKAATAYSRGERSYAALLSEQGKVHNKMALEADEKASREIFEARNKKIENVVTIDLHGQHVKQAIKLLKVHLLLFTAYIPSILFLRVITGCGTHGVGKGKLKQSVISLVEKEGIKWSEENRGTLLIKLDRQKELSFIMESDSD